MSERREPMLASGERGPPLATFAERPHGTRARYVSGCRCAACREANVTRYRERQAQIRELASTVTPSGPPLAGELVRGGRVVKVQRCPGANGQPCVRGGSLLRQRFVCSACIERATVWDGLVSPDRARAHLMGLRRAGVGYKAVAAACDVPTSVLGRILARDRKIRASTERAILAVDAGARADGALISAAKMKRQFAELREMGFSLRQLAELLGYSSKTSSPPQYVTRGKTTALSAARVARLHRRALRGEVVPRPRRGHVDAAAEWKALGELLDRGMTERDLTKELGFHISRAQARKRGKMFEANRAKVRVFLAAIARVRREGAALASPAQAELDLPRNADGRIVGYQVGRAAAIADWAARREERETKRLARNISRRRRAEAANG